MSIFNKIAKAKAMRGGAFIRDGKGRLMVKKLVKPFDGDKGLTFPAEFIVASSQKIAVVSPKTQQALNIEPNEPGTSCSYVQTHLENERKAGQGNVKALFEALLGPEFSKQPEEEQAKDMDAAVEDDQPLLGYVVDYETFRTITKEKREEITVVVFKHAPGENTPEKVKARRATLLAEEAKENAA